MKLLSCRDVLSSPGLLMLLLTLVAADSDHVITDNPRSV